jgi:transcriptional regulator with XRE-family HTH domain
MPDEFYAELGSKIRQRRDAIGMTQSTLAAKAGVSRTSITNMELGGQTILVHQLLNIAKALKVAPATLIPKEVARSRPDPEVEFSEDVQQLLARLEPTANRSKSR